LCECFGNVAVVVVVVAGRKVNGVGMIYANEYDVFSRKREKCQATVSPT